MKTKWMFLSFGLFFFQLFACSDIMRSGRSSRWYLEWQLYNQLDSTFVSVKPEMNLQVISNEKVDQLNAVFSDSSTLFVSLYVGGVLDIDFAASNPVLHARFWYDSVTVLDTTISWADLDFKPGKNYWGDDALNVSKKTFYITVP